MKEITIGFILDLIIGDPQNPYHPIRFIGALCKKLESFFRSRFKNNLKIAGLVTWLVAVFSVYILSSIILWVIGYFSWILATIAAGVMIYFCISTKALKVEGLKVVSFVLKDDIEGARKQLSYIVGRDTMNLDKEAILRAVIETIAENMADGVIAPLLYAGIGGAPLAFAYKAVNTMDSMFGYKNDEYMDFGFFPAKIDDVFNFIPARLAGYLTVAAAYLLGFNGERSLRIYNRDKFNHSSPNSAHPEAAFAGALGVRLGGANYYFGKLVEKPTIGDNLEDITVNKVNEANKLLYVASTMGWLVALLINKLIYMFI